MFLSIFYQLFVTANPATHVCELVLKQSECIRQLASCPVHVMQQALFFQTYDAQQNDWKAKLTTLEKESDSNQVEITQLQKDLSKVSLVHIEM